MSFLNTVPCIECYRVERTADFGASHLLWFADARRYGGNCMKRNYIFQLKWILWFYEITQKLLSVAIVLWLCMLSGAKLLHSCLGQMTELKVCPVSLKNIEQCL